MRARDLGAIGALAALIGWVMYRLITGSEMMPLAAAVEAGYVDHAYDAMLRITVPIFALVIATLIVALIRFRARPGDHEDGPAMHGSKGGLVEAGWLLGSFGLTLGLAAYGSREFLLIRGQDHADLDIEVTASQWSWEFHYPATKTVTDKLLLPQGRRVRLLLRSEDVVHSFWVPQFRLKQDIVPGRISKMLFTPTVPGEYTLQCSELCGRDHSIMKAKVEVLEAAAFDKALKETW